MQQKTTHHKDRADSLKARADPHPGGRPNHTQVVRCWREEGRKRILIYHRKGGKQNWQGKSEKGRGGRK